MALDEFYGRFQTSRPRSRPFAVCAIEPSSPFFSAADSGDPKSRRSRSRVSSNATHDFRRTWAKLCRAPGGELEQIQMLLGRASVQTTERYLGTRQDLDYPVH